MADIVFETLGSKDHHDELRDFQERFDRELNRSSDNSKIIDIHSITKDSTNHYQAPELLRGLLDCINRIEPYGEDSYGRGNQDSSAFVPIPTYNPFESDRKTSRQVVSAVEDFLENYTGHVMNMQSDLVFDHSRSPYLRNIYKARQIQHVAGKMRPLMERKPQPPIPDASILYCRKTAAEPLQQSPRDTEIWLQQQQQLQQQQYKHQDLPSGERGKYWKSMMEEGEELLSRACPRVQRPQPVRQPTPRGSPTPMFGEAPEAQKRQHLLQHPPQPQQQQRSQQHHPPQSARLASPQKQPSMKMLRQYHVSSALAKPIRASISDTAIHDGVAQIWLQQKQQQQLHQQHQQQQQLQLECAIQPPQQQNQYQQFQMRNLPMSAEGDGGRQQLRKIWQPQQQQQPLMQQQHGMVGYAAGTKIQSPTMQLMAQPAIKSGNIVRVVKQQPIDNAMGSISPRPVSGGANSPWNLPVNTALKPNAIPSRGVVYANAGATSIATNNNAGSHGVANRGFGVVGSSLSPSPTALGPYQIGAAPQRPNTQPQQHQQASIWAPSVAPTRALTQQQQQPQQQQQQQQPSFITSASSQVLNGCRAFGPPTSTSNSVSLIAPSVLQPGTVISNGAASTGANGAATTGVILQPGSRLVEVKRVPIQLVSTRPAATFLTLPPTTTAAAGPTSNGNNSGGVNGVCNSNVQPLVSVGKVGQPQSSSQPQQQHTSPPRPWSQQQAFAAGNAFDSQQQSQQRSSMTQQQPSQQQQPLQPQPQPQQQSLWPSSSVGGPFQVSLPGGKLIADNNRNWMDGIVSILEKKSKEGKEAAAAAAAAANTSDDKNNNDNNINNHYNNDKNNDKNNILNQNKSGNYPRLGAMMGWGDGKH